WSWTITSPMGSLESIALQLSRPLRSGCSRDPVATECCSAHDGGTLGRSHRALFETALPMNIHWCCPTDWVMGAENSLRILFVSMEYPPETGGGGIGSYVAIIAPALVARGHEFHVLSC